MRRRPGRSLARAPRRVYRQPRGSAFERFTEGLERWAPPGGWILAALVLLTLSTAAGVIFPLSPAGIVLQTLVGSLGAPLVPAWAAWLAWLLVRRQTPPALRTVSL